MTTDLLSQDEIDALLHGVDSGAVDVEPPPAPGEARTYDFATQERIIRGRTGAAATATGSSRSSSA